MKKIISLLFTVSILCTVKPCNSQVNNLKHLQFIPIVEKEKCINHYDSINSIKYFLNPDSPPNYPGGFIEMENFILKNAKFDYNIDAEGKIIFEFIVAQNGEISGLKIIRKLVDDWDNELIRVIKLLPKWNPGVCNGNKVPVKMEFSYKISLE